MWAVGASPDGSKAPSAAPVRPGQLRRVAAYNGYGKMSLGICRNRQASLKTV